MKKPYLVYLWNSYQVAVSDAYTWARKNGYNPETDFKEVLSEHVFWVYMEKGLLENTPIIFVKDKQ